jgi:hypothetical protein
LPQDGRFQIAHCLAGIYPELLGEGEPQPLVRGKRVGLTPVAVQRQHQLPVKLLIQRVFSHHLLQGRDQLCVLASRQSRLRQGSPDPFAKQVQPCRLFL